VSGSRASNADAAARQNRRRFIKLLPGGRAILPAAGFQPAPAA